MNTPLAAEESSPGQKSNPKWRIGAVIAVLLALLFVILLLVTRGNKNEATPTPSDTQATVAVTPVAPTIVSPDELKAVPQQVGHPIYWAGTVDNRQLELTVLEDGSVYVRYLPEGAKAGSEKPFLTVATYRRPDAYALVQGGGNRPGAVMVKDKGGALVSSEGEKATNAYFAFEGTPLLVEVYDPIPGKAFDTIQSGQVQLVQ